MSLSQHWTRYKCTFEKTLKPSTFETVLWLIEASADHREQARKISSLFVTIVIVSRWVFLVIWLTLSVASAMNSSGGKTPSTARPPAYKANALAMIRNELSQFANSGESSSSGQQSPQPPQNQQVSRDSSSHSFQSPTLIFPAQSSSQSQNIDRDVLLIRQMLSQAGMAGFEVSVSRNH